MNLINELKFAVKHLLLAVFMLSTLLIPQLSNAEATDESQPVLHRFFTTASQRLALDNARQQGGAQATMIAEINPQHTEISVNAPLVVLLKGLVLRNDGRHVVWLNDTNTLHPANNDNTVVDIKRINSHTVSIPVSTHGLLSQHTRALKPGQLWKVDDNTVEENFHTPPVIKQKETPVELAEPAAGTLENVRSKLNPNRREAEANAILKQGDAS
jgi:hypothetical protein